MAAIAWAWNLRVLAIRHGTNGTLTKLTGLPVAASSCLNLALLASSQSSPSPARTMHAPDTPPAVRRPLRKPKCELSAWSAGPQMTPPMPVPEVMMPRASARREEKWVGLTVTAGMKDRLVAHPSRKPCVSWNCHSRSDKDASRQARKNRIPPAGMMMRGLNRLVKAVTNGAPIVINATERVPIRSILAGLAPVKGVPASSDMSWYKSW